LGFSQWMRKNLFRVKDQNGALIGEQEVRSLYRRCISIAWPSTVEGALLSIIGSMDTMMVGTLGSAAIAAVGLTGQPRMILLICVQALCVGTTALCARRRGAEDREGANSCLAQSLAVVTVLGLLMTAIGYFGADWFMMLAGANEDTLQLSADYFRIISLGMVFNSWSLCICAAMRAVGQTRITMVTNITANIVNVCLNFVLINGYLGFPALGVKGAAIATLCSTMVSFAIAVWFVCHRDGYYHFSLPKFDRATMSGLLKVGSSSVLESACLRVGFLVTARLVAGIGTDAFAAYQIVSQVTTLSFTLGDGAATAGTSLVGQNLGARRKDLAMATVRITRKVSVILSFALMIFIFLFRRQLGLLFTREEEILTGVTLSFCVVVFGILSQNGRVVYAGCLRGAGDVKYVAACALLSVTVLRPVLTYFFCYPAEAWFPGRYIAVMGPWIAFVIDAFVREALLYRRIRKGKWLEIELG
jgi:putative MATE family efflux protein